MMKSLLGIIIAVALVGTFVLEPQPRTGPRVVASLPATPPSAAVGAAEGPLLPWANKPPVPLWRNLRTAQAQPEATERSGYPEMAVAGRLGIGAAAAAIEADGYRRVSGLDKDATGRWRARAYRGAVEVHLIVDHTGSVSAE